MDSVLRRHTEPAKLTPYRLDHRNGNPPHHEGYQQW